MEAMTQSFRSLAVGASVLAAGAGTLGTAFGAANLAGDFEQKVASVGAVAHASGDELRGLHDAAIQAGLATQFSPTAAAEGLQVLATAGQTAQQSIQTLLPVLDLAAGSLGDINVSTAADAVVGTLNSYGMAAEDAALVTDKLLKTTLLTNFATRDFEAGLGKAAGQGAQFNQSLDDALITLGLLRNRNIDASSASTAYREATRRLASDTGAQAAIQKLGVDIYDRTTGKMRQLTDISNDVAGATQSMTDQERNRILVQGYGARGLLAYGAIAKAQFTTQKDGVDVTYAGRDAILALREEMQHAAGTSEYFREKLLDTYNGQKTLLGGTLQTAAILFGEPFAQVLKPVVKTVVDTMNAALVVFRKVPDSVKRGFAVFVLAAGSVLTVVGAFLTLQAAIAVGAILFKILGISIGAIVGALWPVVAVAALATVTFLALRKAVQLDLGGLGSRFASVLESVKLGFEGLMQLLDGGELAGAVQQALAEPKNATLKSFVIGLYQLFYRLGRIGEGIQFGFLTQLQEFEPVFQDLNDAGHALSDALGVLFKAFLGSADALPSERFHAFGAILGRIAGIVGGLLVRAIAVVTNLFAGLAQGWAEALQPIGVAMTYVRLSIHQLVEAWDTLAGSSETKLGPDDASTSGWRTFGYVISTIVGGAIGLVIGIFGFLVQAVTAVVEVLGGARQFFEAFGTAVKEVGHEILDFFTETIPNAIEGAIDGLVDPLKRLFSGVPDVLAPEVVSRGGAMRRPAMGAMPAEVEAQANAATRTALLRSEGDARGGGANGNAGPINVQLQVDGETLARVTAAANVRTAQRTFTPLPAV
jgi:TP901 family phage tail tape measure protein